MVLHRAGQTDIPSYDGELGALHVRRKHQHQGIGRQLLAAVATKLSQQGCHSLLLWTLEQNLSRGLYERLGGQCIARRTIELGEGDITAVGVPTAGRTSRSPCVYAGRST